MKQALVKTLTCVAVAVLCGTPQAVLAQEGTRLNKLIELFENDQSAFGVLSFDYSLNNARAMATSGLDFVFIDMEHAPLTPAQVRGHLMAMKGSDCAALVRVPWNDQVLIKPVLDMGTDGIIVPMAQTAEDVAQAFVDLARSRKTTAATVTVDGGNIAASLR